MVKGAVRPAIKQAQRGQSASLVPYIAVKLPNAPQSARSAIALAAQNSALGRGYSARSVIDSIATFEWWNCDSTAQLYTDTGLTTPAVNGENVAAIANWGASTIALSQSTASRRGTRIISGSASGLSSDGIDDWYSAASNPTFGTAHIVIVSVISLSGSSIRRIATTASTGLRFGVNGSDSLQLGIAGTLNTLGAVGNGTAILAGRFDGSTLEGYKNNSSVGSVVDANAYTTGGQVFRILANAGGTGTYTGGVFASFWLATTHADVSHAQKVVRFANAYHSLGLTIA